MKGKVSRSGSVLVTGGTGFVGRALLQALIDRGEAVRAPVRSEMNGLPRGVELISFSGLDGTMDWRPSLMGVSVVVHAAAQVDVVNGQAGPSLAEFRRINVEGTLNLARQAAAAGVRRFVFLSSIKVNGGETAEQEPFRANDVPAPEGAYGISKREAEDGLMELARETGMSVVIIRPPLVYGPGVKGNFASMLRWVDKGLPLPLGAVRNNRRSLVALANLVDLVLLCLDHPEAVNQVFLAGDGEDLSTAELLERVALAMGRRPRMLPVPVWMLRLVATMLGKCVVARRLCGSLQVDISRTREVLGWTPPVSVDEGLEVAVRGRSRLSQP